MLTSGVIQYCQEQGITFLPHSPVGGYHGHVRTRSDPALGRIAQGRGVSPYQVCLAWLLTLSPVMIPIPGSSRIESAESSATAGELRLGGDERAELNAAFGIGS